MKKSTFLLILFWLSFFQNVIRKEIPVLTFFDEVLTIWALWIILKEKWRKKVYVCTFSLIVCLTVVGIYCNFHYGIQTNMTPIFNDIGNCFKVFITYFGASLYFRTFPKKESERFVLLCGKTLFFMIYVMSICAVLNVFVDIGMGYDVRYGIRSFAFLDSGEANFLTTFYLIFPMTLFYMSITNAKRPVLILSLLSIIYILTLRSRAFVYVTILCLLYYYMIYKDKKFKLTWKNIIVFIIVAFMICYDQIRFYMDEGQSARYVLLANGIDILKNNFPVGYGFGTYGTDVAARYYSKVYEMLGFNQIYGLSQDYSAFACDSYWPAIMGQFGAVGVIVMGLCIYLLFKDMLDESKNKYVKLIAVIVCMCLLLSSTADAIFFHFVTVESMFFLAFIFNVKMCTTK